MPIGDADAQAWWFASLLAYKRGKPKLDELAIELSTIAPRDRA